MSGYKYVEVKAVDGVTRECSCTAFVAYDEHKGLNWYVKEGGTIVSGTYAEITTGINLSSLDSQDVDCFTWSKPISDLDELKQAVEDL